MNDLIGKAHAYLDDKGCKSMAQEYTAFEIEQMLAEFAEQQLLDSDIVSGNEVDYDLNIQVPFKTKRYKMKVISDKSVCGCARPSPDTCNIYCCNCGKFLH